MEIVKLVLKNNTKGLSIWDDYLEWDDCIHKAYLSGNMEIIELIAKNNWTNWSDCLTVVCCCDTTNIEFIDYMIKNGAVVSDSALYSACARNDSELFMHLVNICVQDLSSDINMDTILKYACFCGDLDIVQIFMGKIAGESGESGESVYNEGLKLACRQGHVDIVKLLIENGATDFNMGLVNNNTDNADISNMLIRKGANMFSCLHSTNDFKLYSLHCSRHWTKCVTENKKYMHLFAEYPPCVLFVGSRCSKNVKVCRVKRLPVELFKLLAEY